MKNNNTLPEKIDGFYFWNGDVTFEVSTEAAQRWNNYPALVEALKEVLRFKHELKLVMGEKLQYPDNFISAIDKADELLQTLDIK